MGRNASPIISVILAVYNGESFILGAMDSIVQQENPALEIIVVDDGSTDKTVALVREFSERTDVSTRYVYRDYQGPGAARNYGLRLARGDVIAFQDADDLWPPNRLPAQLAKLAESSDLGIVLGRKHFLGDDANADPNELERANNQPVHYVLGSSLFRRWVFDEVGAFDESMRHCSDWDWFVRAKEVGIRTEIVPEVTLVGLIHTENLTRKRDTSSADAIQMIRRRLRRQQAADGQA